jgi:hypothetical protein
VCAQDALLGGKPRFMERPKGEPLERTLARIQKNAAPAPGAHPSMRIFSCCCIAAEATAWLHAWIGAD